MNDNVWTILLYEPFGRLILAVWLACVVGLVVMAWRGRKRQAPPEGPDHAWVRANVPGMANAPRADVEEMIADIQEDGAGVDGIFGKK